MGKLISKKAIMVGNCDGFVGNRMLAPYAGEAKMVLEEGRTSARSRRGPPVSLLAGAAGLTAQGASIEQVDAAAQKFGSPAAEEKSAPTEQRAYTLSP